MTQDATKDKATSFTTGVLGGTTIVEWALDGIGFGELALTNDPITGLLMIHNEGMNRDKLKRIFNALIMQAVLVDNEKIAMHNHRINSKTAEQIYQNFAKCKYAFSFDNYTINSKSNTITLYVRVSEKLISGISDTNGIYDISGNGYILKLVVKLTSFKPTLIDSLKNACSKGDKYLQMRDINFMIMQNKSLAKTLAITHAYIITYNIVKND